MPVKSTGRVDDRTGGALVLGEGDVLSALAGVCNVAATKQDHCIHADDAGRAIGCADHKRHQTDAEVQARLPQLGTSPAMPWPGAVQAWAADARGLVLALRMGADRARR
ncbi:hypothetical protein AB0D12_23870 [Streptomyces sp. NPDC048479]|uniref:hypothetical protein n=1 Tax=Streptomyces sp. NPDC048479 TaxID=3154725 RepID=UPI00342962FB